MRSTEKYELPRMELQRIFEELRGLAQELNVPIWTATQSNKEGSKQDFIDMTNMAESYGQSHACDVIFGFHRKPEMKATGYGTLFIAKNRAGKDGIQFYVHLDTSKSKLKIISEMEPELAENATSGNNGGGNNFSSSHGNNNSSQSSSAISALRKIYKEQQKEKSENNPVKLESLA
jgi:hypothetical protein